VRLAVALALAAAIAGAAHAQDWGRFRRGGFRFEPPRMASDASFDGSWNFCRGMYESVRREALGQGWRTDYPDADINFSIRLSELTKTRVSRQPDGQPNHLVVRLTDDELFRCPFIEMEDTGTVGFSDAEVARLREYLLKGGFLWVDDFWGDEAWDQWSHEIARVLPPSEYPIVDLPPTHPLFRMQFTVAGVPQIPSIQFWRSTGGLTSERGDESAVPHIRGISDRHGRLMVVMTHNTDVSDAWEREGEDPRFFYSFSPEGYALGINVVLYALSH
jgi:hypothetical protein